MPIELIRHRGKQRPVEVSRQQRATEPDEGRALWRRLIRRKSAEASERGPIVESFGELHVREVVPDRHQESLEQGQRGPGLLALRGGVDRSQVAVDRGPVDQAMKI